VSLLTLDSEYIKLTRATNLSSNAAKKKTKFAEDIRDCLKDRCVSRTAGTLYHMYAKLAARSNAQSAVQTAASGASVAHEMACFSREDVFSLKL
jgi:hypothetical protein